MAYKFSFADNTVYSASDINEITKRLVTSGIEDSFTDGVAYNVSRFNEAGKLLYTSGVVPQNCFTLKVVKASDTEILINPGLAFFNDGATIEIEVGGETLPFVLGSKNYVYLKNELVDKNICYPYCGTEKPLGDCVLLAEIDENGVITDKRTYARGKVGGYQSVSGEPLRLVETIKTVVTGYTVASGEAEFDIGDNNFEYLLFLPADDGSLQGALSLYRIADGKIMSFYQNGSAANLIDKSVCLGYDNEKNSIRIQLSFVGGILKIQANVGLYAHHSPSQFGREVNVLLNCIFI